MSMFVTIKMCVVMILTIWYVHSKSYNIIGNIIIWKKQIIRRIFMIYIKYIIYIYYLI